MPPQQVGREALAGEEGKVPSGNLIALLKVPQAFAEACGTDLTNSLLAFLQLVVPEQIVRQCGLCLQLTLDLVVSE